MEKNKAAQSLGKLGGKAVAKKMGPDGMSELAKISWIKRKNKQPFPKEHYQELRRKSGEAKAKKKAQQAKVTK